MPEVTSKNISTRNRKTQAAFRKQQLILATIDCIDSLGLSQTTLNRVAERAGMSQGNVIFHFQTKDILLENALLHLDTEYRDNWQKCAEKVRKLTPVTTKKPDKLVFFGQHLYP